MRWREIPIRDDLQGQYEKCWQTAINAILESNFAVATMDKESGYIRTTENSGVVILKGDWVYNVQVSIKFAYIPPHQASKEPCRKSVSRHRAISPGQLAERSVNVLV
jgi:hypothetical protein